MPSDQDVLIRNLSTGSTERALAGDANYFPVAWSPDGLSVSAVDFISNSDTTVYLVTPGEGAARSLTPHEGEVQSRPRAWAADSCGFFLVSDEGREFVPDLPSSPAGECLPVAGDPAWDIAAVAVSGEGRYLAWVVNERRVPPSVRPRSIKRQLVDCPRSARGDHRPARRPLDGRMLAILLNLPRASGRGLCISISQRWHPDAADLQRSAASIRSGPDAPGIGPLSEPTTTARSPPSSTAREAGAVSRVRLDPRRTRSSGTSGLRVLRALPILGSPGHWGARAPMCAARPAMAKATSGLFTATGEVTSSKTSMPPRAFCAPWTGWTPPVSGSLEACSVGSPRCPVLAGCRSTGRPP